MFKESRLPSYRPEGAPPQKEFIPGDPEAERSEILALQPHKVLAICRAGKDRSRIIAQELEKRGYTAWHRGVDGFTFPLTQKDIDAAEAVIFAGEYMANKAINKYEFGERPMRMLKLVESVHASQIRSGEEGETAVGEVIAAQLDELGFIPLDEVEDQPEQPIQDPYFAKSIVA